MPGGAEAGVVALNKTTGEVIWKAAVPESTEAGYGSLVTANAAGVKQYVAFLGGGLSGIDAKTGKRLWFYDKIKKNANIPTPIVKDDMIFCSTGQVGGSVIKLSPGEGTDQKGSEQKIEQLYFDVKAPNAIGGSVLVGNNLFGCSGNALKCVDFLTGETKWESRSAAPGSIIVADGKLFLHGESNELVLAEATSAEYKELGRVTPPNAPKERGRGVKAWAYPVLADGKLYIRDMGTLWVYDVSTAGNTK